MSLVAILALTEVLARVSGDSFIKQCQDLFKTINQGSFEEGYVFLWKYMSTVEGATGRLLVFYFGLFLVFSIRKCPAPIVAIFVLVILGYFYHATMLVVFKKTVFYGRLIHMYVPFIVWSLVLFLKYSLKDIHHRLIIPLVLCFSLASFLAFAARYVRLSYPIDFRYK